MDARLAGYVGIPAWLPPEQREAFRERALRAFAQVVMTHGERALTPFVRGRILGGLATAFKFHRLDAAWGRRMLSRRGTKGRLRAVAMAGQQRRAYFAELGRLGGRRSASRRRLATAHPHIRRVLRGQPPPTRNWMLL